MSSSGGLCNHAIGTVGTHFHGKETQIHRKLINAYQLKKLASSTA